MDNSAKAAVRRAQSEAAKVQSSVVPGLVKSADWVAGLPVTVVTVGGVDFTNLPVLGGQSLIPGQTVNVLRLLGQYVVLGFASADVQPVQGTVTATGTGVCQVAVSYSSGPRALSCPWVTSYTPTIGDVVLLRWVSGTAVVQGKLSQPLPTALTPPYVPTPPPPALPSGTSGVSIFPAFFTGSSPLTDQINWAPGALTADAVTVGAWFYGSTVADSMVGRILDPARPPEFYFPHGLAPDGFEFSWVTATYPGEQSFGGAGVGMPTWQPGWVPADVSSVENIVNSRGSFGIGPLSGSKAFMPGINEDPLSGALRIYWVTT